MKRWHRLFLPGSLGGKLVWMLTAIGLGGAVAITMMLAVVITPTFERLEDAAVGGHVERTHIALRDFASKVERASRDQGERFATLPAPAMADADIDGVAYVAPDRSIRARWIDPATRRDIPTTRDRWTAGVAAIDLNRRLGTRGSASFYLRLDDRLAAVGVARLRDGVAAPDGFVVMARTLSSDELAGLLGQKAAIRFDPVGSERRVATSARSLRIAVPVVGVDGAPVADAVFAVRRDLTMLGRQLLWLSVGGTLLLLLIVLAVLTRMIAQLVLRPLATVERHMQAVRTSGTMRVLPQDRRDDEIGSLVTSLNAMLCQLNDLSEQVEAQSFTLGRTESAVAVMHNVRNALSPISTILSHGLAQPPVADRAVVDRAIAELADDTVSPARRRKLAGYLSAAAQATMEARLERVRQLEIGRTALHQVLEIIGQQQHASHERPPVDPCDVTDIVARNAAIARYSRERSIAFSFPAQPRWVLANRVILSQVIGNLFANASEAIAAQSEEGGQIAVTIAEAAGEVIVTIVDDGEGFDPSDAPMLFQRGFSTRTNKSGGLGLHWCANSVVAMGGRIDLFSDGRGRGARAVLRLPAATAMVSQAA